MSTPAPPPPIIGKRSMEDGPEDLEYGDTKRARDEPQGDKQASFTTDEPQGDKQASSTIDEPQGDKQASFTFSMNGDASIPQLKYQITQLEQQNDKLSRELNEAQTDQTLDKEASDAMLDQEVQELRAKDEEQLKEIERLKILTSSGNPQRDIEFAELQNKIDQMEKNMPKDGLTPVTQRQWRKLNEDVARLSQSAAVLNKNHEPVSQVQYNNLTNEVIRHEDDARELHRKIRKLEEQAQTPSDSIPRDRKTGLPVTQELVDSLTMVIRNQDNSPKTQEQYNEEKKDHRKLVKENERLQKQVDQLPRWRGRPITEDEYAAMDRQVYEAKNNLRLRDTQEKRAMKKAFDDHVAMLEKQNTALKTEADGHIANWVKECDRLRSIILPDLQDHTQPLAWGTVTQIIAERDGLRGEASEFRKQISDLQAQRTLSPEQEQKLEAEYQKETQAKIDAEKKCTTLEEEIKKLQGDINEQKQKQEETEANIGSLNKTMGEQKDHISDLNRDLSNRDEHIRNAQSDLEKAKNELEQKVQSIEGQKDKAEKDAEELRYRETNTQKAMNMATAQKDMAEREVEELRAQNIDAKGQITKLEAGRSKDQAELKDLKKTLDAGIKKPMAEMEGNKEVEAQATHLRTSDEEIEALEENSETLHDDQQPLERLKGLLFAERKQCRDAWARMEQMEKEKGNAGETLKQLEDARTQQKQLEKQLEARTKDSRKCAEKLRKTLAARDKDLAAKSEDITAKDKIIKEQDNGTFLENQRTQSKEHSDSPATRNTDDFQHPTEGNERGESDAGKGDLEKRVEELQVMPSAMSHFQNRDKGTEAESKLRHDLKDIASHSEQPRKKIETFRQEREQKPEEHDSLDKQCRELQETLRRKESYIKELETASGKSEGSRRTNKDGANRQSNDDLAQLEKVLGTSPILPVIDEAPSGQFDSDRAQISSANTGSPMSHNPPKAATAPGQTSTKFSTVLTRCQFGYGALALLAFLFLVTGGRFLWVKNGRGSERERKRRNSQVKDKEIREFRKRQHNFRAGLKTKDKDLAEKIKQIVPKEMAIEEGQKGRAELQTQLSDNKQAQESPGMQSIQGAAEEGESGESEGPVPTETEEDRDLKKQLIAAKAEKKNLRRQLDQLKQQQELTNIKMIQLENDLAATVENDSLTSEKEKKLKEKYDEQIYNLELEIQEHLVEIQERVTRDAMKGFQNSYEEIQDTNRTLKEDIVKLTKELEKLKATKAEIPKVTNATDHPEEDIERLRQDLNKSAEEAKKKAEIMEKMQGDHLATNDRFHALQEDYRAVRNDAADFLKTIDGLHTDFKSMERELTAKSTKIDKLQAKVERLEDPNAPKPDFNVIITEHDGETAPTETMAEHREDDVLKTGDPGTENGPESANIDRYTGDMDKDRARPESTRAHVAASSTGSTERRLAWGITMLLLIPTLLSGLSWFVSKQREESLLGRGDDVARLALLSLRAGGGSGASWPGYLYDDKVLTLAGGFYG